MKTAVTGASGHLGVNLIRKLISGGGEVKAISHLNNDGFEGLDVELVSGDVLDAGSLSRAFEGVEQVYHLAGYISLLANDWAACSAVNVEGTRNVVNACRQAGVKRLVHFSSIHAFCQEPFDIPIDESRQFVDIKKAPAYDRSKAAGEQIVRRAVIEGLDAVIINPTAVIGPFDYRPSHTGQAIIQMATGKLPVLIDGGFDWVDARDVADGAIKAAEIAPAGSRYLLSGHWLSLKGLAEMVSSISGVKPPSFTCPIGIARACAPLVTFSAHLAGKRPIYTTASLKAVISNRDTRHDKASAELGYEPRPLEETVCDTVNWFRENGYLRGDK
jgi:dihydroflavonol-4-reductase